LDDIWSFGFERWGEAQADRYSARIVATMGGLLDNPFLGSPLRNGTRKLRSIKSGVHRIVYEVDAKKIGVVRILHSSREFGRHLP
jgi:toxin ParE1/3/4